MTRIPIFDSLVHPTLDGNWILPKYPACASFNNLQRQMLENDIVGAFAVGMKGIGGYDEDEFVARVRQYSNLKPVAFFGLESGDTEKQLLLHLKEIKRKGYVGIKLHPRIGQFTLDDSRLPYIIDEANRNGLTVLFCTYFYSRQSMLANNIGCLAEMLSKLDESSKVILLHGGTVRLLECMEIVRAFPNLLMDISLVMCKYAGSSLDQDVSFLFQQFDQRICIGSDHPEISLFQLRSRFEHFAALTSIEKAENIGYKNIVSFTMAK